MLSEIIEAFKSTSRYLYDLSNIDDPYFEGMVNRIYPPELQLNKANISDTKALCLDLHLSIQTDLFHLKFMISAMTLILIYRPLSLSQIPRDPQIYFEISVF